MKTDFVYLKHISDAINNIFEYTELNKDLFISSRLVQDAVMRNFQIIGEATKKLSEITLVASHDIPWSKMSKFRDKIVHGYMGVDYGLVWDVIEKELPKILSKIEKLII